MEVIDCNIDHLIPYENNPRKNDQAVEAVANSIKEFGFKVPCVIDKDGIVVCGHTRIKAAKKLGLDTVPCVIADDLTDDQIKAFRLADNSTADLAEWDNDLLQVELEEIDLDVYAFGLGNLNSQDIEISEIEESEVPSTPKEPRAKYGDIYRLGQHVLMCGDATSHEDVTQLMEEGGGKLTIN